MDPQKVKQKFTSAGWYIDDSFSEHLVIGCRGDDLSIVAHPEEVLERAEEPLFEIFDHERYATYWVRQIPTPQQALQLLREHGEPPEEWDKP